MRISTTSGLNASWFQARRSKPSRLSGERADTYRSSYRSDIRMERDMRIDLGSINGKPFYMWHTPLGGSGWTGTPPVQGPTTGKVSQADIEAVRLASSYTRAESEYAEKIVTVVNGLYRLTQPTKLPLSVQGLNDLLKEHSIDSSIVADALSRLGVNAKEMFSVNGQKMHFSDGKFVLGSTR